MRSDVVRMYREIHSWAGIIVGLFLFIAFYAGAITMFEVPLQRWASEPVEQESITPLENSNELITKVLTEYPEAEKNFYIALQTGPEMPSRMHWQQRDSDDHHAPATHHYANMDGNGDIDVKVDSPSPVASIVDVIHQQLGLLFEHEVAMIITGSVSLIYGLALISGIIVLLPTIAKDAFAVRIGKKVKRMWLDVHNILGLFSIPFHLVIAFTSVIFAFHDQLYFSQNKTIYSSVAEVSQQTSNDNKIQNKVEINPELLLPADKLVAKLKDQAPDYQPVYLNYLISRENKLELRVGIVNPRYIATFPREGAVIVDPFNGDILRTAFMPGKQESWQKVVSSFFTLHFGNYGGNFTRWCYFLLGLAGAFLFYTGNLLWIETRRKKQKVTNNKAPTEQSSSSRLVGALTIGVCFGCIMAISAIIATSKLTHGMLESSFPGGYEGFFYLLLITSIIWAFIRGAALGAVELIITAAFTTALIPLASLLSMLVPGYGWNHADATVMVDIVAITGTVGLLLIAKKTANRIYKAPRESIWFSYNASEKNRLIQLLT